jgi:large conductance mechanosensitive channel
VIKEFRAFLTKTNALALAVGVIIGAAVGKVVTELASGILMPVIGLLLPTGNWRQARYILRGAVGKTAETAILYGQFIGAVVDFLVIALVVFLIVRALVKPAPAEPTKTCPECLEKVPVAARRCRACTSALS